MITKTNRNKIAIATDVIAQIKSRKYRPTCGTYVNGDLLNNLEAGDDLQEKVLGLKKGAACEVCALGSAFLSCVGLNNNYEVTESEAEWKDISQERMREKLSEFFTTDELGVIESTFEVDSAFLYDIGEHHLGNEFAESPRFHEALNAIDEEQRLLFVMQSIVNLSGTVTLDGFKQQLLLAAALDPKFDEVRKSLLGGEYDSN